MELLSGEPPVYRGGFSMLSRTNFKTSSEGYFSMSSVGTFVSSCPVAHRAHGTHRAPSSMVNYDVDIDIDDVNIDKTEQ